MSWDAFVVLSLAGSCGAQRSPCAVCHFPWDSVTDYPCSQARRRITSTWPRDRPKRSFFHPSPKCCALLPAAPFISLPSAALRVITRLERGRVAGVYSRTTSLISSSQGSRIAWNTLFICICIHFYPKLRALCKLCKSLIKWLNWFRPKWPLLLSVPTQQSSRCSEYNLCPFKRNSFNSTLTCFLRSQIRRWIPLFPPNKNESRQ